MRFLSNSDAAACVDRTLAVAAITLVWFTAVGEERAVIRLGTPCLPKDLDWSAGSANHKAL
jgi:hypothetical protein